MKYFYKGFIIKVNFYGDSTTPMYKYRLYKKSNKFWFSTYVWQETYHRDEIGTKISNKFDDLIESYKREQERWS